jgi:uncharacterized protein (DUF4415 family)
MATKRKKTKTKPRRPQPGRVDLKAAAEDSFWEAVKQTAREPRWDRPRKKAVSVRLDPEVLEWLKAQGPGYQTRISRILRRVMEEGKKKAS